MKDSQNIFSELYHDGRGDKPPIKKNFDGPPIMKDEVRKAVKSMKKGKAAGPDKITVEMIESLDEFGIDMLTDFLNAIYGTGEIPSDLSKSICIALPKKPGATECESHRTISLMSHITKIRRTLCIGLRYCVLISLFALFILCCVYYCIDV